MATNSADLPCNSIWKALIKRGRSIRNIAVFLLVWGAQAASKDLFFQCPCYEVTPGSIIPGRRESYSIMWMFVPAMVLWLMSVLLLDVTWRCATGCRNRPRPHPNQGCMCCWKVLSESALAPVTWLFLVFIDGTFMECAQAYVPTSCLDPNNLPTNLNDIEKKNTDARWLSAMIGLGLVLGLMMIYFIVILCHQCSSDMSYYQTRYHDHIHQLEQDALDDAAREENYSVFKARWKALFHTGTDADWTDASSLPYTTPVKKKAGYIYTQFHGMRFAEEHAYMDTDILPPYPSARREFYVIPEVQAAGAGHITELPSPTKAPPATSHKVLAQPQEDRTSHQEPRKKKKKKKTPVIRITSPQESDDTGEE